VNSPQHPCTLAPLHHLVAVFNELIKLVFYWARYGIAPFG